MVPAARRRAWPRTRPRQRAAELLHDVGLADRAHHRPGSLSGGQMQRVAIARALALDPPVIVADEPTANLDHVQVETVLRILRGLTRRGRTVIVSTHDQRLLPLADQVVEMSPGHSTDLAPSITVNCAAGEELFAEGAEGTRIYRIESGADRAHPRRRAPAHRRAGRGVRRDGAAVQPAPFGPGGGHRTHRTHRAGPSTASPPSSAARSCADWSAASKRTERRGREGSASNRGCPAAGRAYPGPHDVPGLHSSNVHRLLIQPLFAIPRKDLP